MAHYAFLDENNIVTEVIPGIDESELIEGLHPEIWYGNFRNQTCKRTSYNTYGGQHIFDEIPFRKNYANIGYIYDEIRDAFIPPQPYPSWRLNEDSCIWYAPVSYPEDGNSYTWDEDSQSWTIVEL